MQSNHEFQPDFVTPSMNDYSRLHQYAHESLKRLPLPTGSNSNSPLSSSSSQSMPVLPPPNPTMQDLLWLSKHRHQQQIVAMTHPLKNTIRISSNGVRHKFDGKQWRPLCESPDGYECRNLAFRSSLCQKHFYKFHLFKRPYTKHNTQIPSAEVPNGSLKRPSSEIYERSPRLDRSSNGHSTEDDDDCIQLLEDHQGNNLKRAQTSPKDGSEHEYTFLTIDCDPSDDQDPCDNHSNRDEPLPKMKRFDSPPHEFDSPPMSISPLKIPESVRLGIPPLTRTEEKSLAQELITQLPADASLVIGEQMARRRACEIVHDNYSHPMTPMNISADWFYDFLLRNPRVPIHFQSWFANVKSTMPVSDQLIEIKMWELKLVTRSVITSSALSTSSSSSP